MDATEWKVLADSYERTADSLGRQAREWLSRGDHTTGGALLCASYTVGAMRAAALDVFDHLRKAEGDG